MRNGAIEQWDTAYNLYHTPRTRFVADFVGQGGVPARRRGGGRPDAHRAGHARRRRAGQRRGRRAGGRAAAPDDIVHDDASPWHAEVAAKAFRGAEFLYTLRLASGTHVMSVVPSHHNHALGERIGIRLAIDHVVAFPAEV